MVVGLPTNSSTTSTSARTPARNKVLALADGGNARRERFAVRTALLLVFGAPAIAAL
jgi:hypothetical protein